MDNDLLPILTARPFNPEIVQRLDPRSIAFALQELLENEERETYPNWEELQTVGIRLWRTGHTQLDPVLEPWLFSDDPKRWLIAAAFLEGYWGNSPTILPEGLQFLDQRASVSPPGSELLHSFLLLIVKVSGSSVQATRFQAVPVLKKWLDRGAEMQVQEGTLWHMRKAYERGKAEMERNRP